ncbi:hypothetical protein [Oceaniglobus indicus]|uniref:hypothetical protein n=1 Tax=Oceaniglobus indicus TaxID=2047749 RepID=UPI000C1A7834|nr:hypothetical protein [Oceaniglobus indicus]
MTDRAAPLAQQPGSYFDWPAIIGGGVVATAIGILFAGFGAALGLSAISPYQGEGSGGFALILVGAWLLITTVAAYGAGGYIAGRMRRRVDNADKDEVAARDSMHGAVVWGLGLLLSAWMAAGVVGTTANTVGNVAQGAAGAVSSVAQGAASAAGSAGNAIEGVNVNPLQIINQRLLRGTGIRVDGDATLPDGAMAVLGDIVRTGEIDEGDREYLATAIAQNSNLSQAGAEARVDEAAQEVIALREQAEAAVADAEQAARDAAEAARTASVLTGFALAAAFLIAAVAAIWGSSVGGRHRDEGRLFRGFHSI